MSRGITYLACPYSYPSREVRQSRFESANRAAGELMVRGLIVFSPVSHSHMIAEQCNLPFDFTFWREWNLAFLALSKQMYVLRCLGWTESVGLKAEMDYAIEAQIPVFFMDED